MDTEEKLRELVNYAIHHLSCGYTSNNERILALQHLQRGLHNIDAVEHTLAPDAACGHASSDNWKMDESGNMYCVLCRAGKA